MHEPGWARKTLRYRLLRYLYRRGWRQDMPLIGLDPSGRRDSTIALQALLDTRSQLRLPGTIKLTRTVAVGHGKSISGGSVEFSSGMRAAQQAQEETLEGKWDQ